MDEEATRVQEYCLGRDLSTCSKDDLHAYLEALRDEIARVTEAVSSRGATRSAAEQFFKR